MSKLMIYTQCRENYGSAEEPYWKFKGGCEYAVKDVDVNIDLTTLVQRLAKEKIEIMDAMFEEYVLDWEVVGDDFITEYEQNQLDWLGRVNYPTTVLEA